MSVITHPLSIRIGQWIAGRHGPESRAVLLDRRRVYILPTKPGMLFGAAMLVLLIGSINYSLQLGYMLTFLVTSMAIVGMHTTHSNLAQIVLRGVRVEPVFAGDVAVFQITAANPTTADRTQKVSATLTVEVKDSDAVSRAAQSALDVTRSLGGCVVSSSVATGDEGSASITVRVPVDKVQDAIAGLSGLGRIVSQNVTIEDRQESIDAFVRQSRSIRAQIALVTARLESGTLDTETQARLEARLENLKTDLLVARRSLGTLRAEARMSTIQLTVVTPGAFGAVAPPSRIDRTVDEALNVLAWEGVVALGILIVVAPFALVAGAVWLGRRLYRRREEERLLAA